MKNGKSAPLRNYQMAGPVAPQPPREVKNKQLPAKGSRPGTTDTVVQRRFGLTTPGELGQFEGGSSQDNADTVGFQVAPPDTNGDIGLNHYVQYINLIVTMYDRDGSIALGPLPGNAFWEGLGGICEAQNDGDPIVLYDQLADRWFVSQFAFPASRARPTSSAWRSPSPTTRPVRTTSTSSSSVTTSTTIRSSASGPTPTT